MDVLSRRTLLSSMLAASVALPVVSACGRGDSGGGSSGARKVKFWSMGFWIGVDDAEKQLKKLIAEYNASKPEVEVEFTFLEWKDGRQKIKQATAAGTGPDVFLIPNGLDLDYLKAGRLASLDDLGYSKEDIGRFSSLIEANSYEEKLYGVPLYSTSVVLLYRTDIFKTYGIPGPPKTWAELHDSAAKITRDSKGAVHGWQFKGMDDHLNAINNTWKSFLVAAGGELMSPDFAQSSQNSAAGRKALEYIRGFYAEKISPVGTSAQQGFIEGKVAMFCFDQTVIADLNLAGDKLAGKWAAAPMPVGAGSGQSLMSGHSLAANAKSPQLEGAGAFMRWLASPEQSLRYMDFYGTFPYDLAKVPAEIRKGVSEKIAGDDTWQPLVEQSELNSPAVIEQDRYGYLARYEAIKAQIVSAANGQTSPAEALKTIDQQVDEALGS